MLTRAAKATNDDHEPTNGQKVVWGDENPWTQGKNLCLSVCLHTNTHHTLC